MLNAQMNVTEAAQQGVRIASFGESPDARIRELAGDEVTIGPTAVCFFLIQFASAHLPAAKVIAYGYLVPALVIVLEGIAGHGWATLSVAAGALVTVLGLLVLALLRER